MALARVAGFIAVATLFACGCATPSYAASESVVYSFKGGTDGSDPESEFVKAGKILFGTTNGGGVTTCYGGQSVGCGTAFKFSLSGREKVLHAFAGGTDGFASGTGLTKVGDLFYGVTYNGGGPCLEDENGQSGCGVFYSISKQGAEKVLYAFDHTQGDGFYPNSTLVNVAGTLYGTTFNGGAHGQGTIFAVTPNGAETVIYSFPGGTDGLLPNAGLTNINGTLYGTASMGGFFGYGNVFKITPQGVFTVIYSFQEVSGNQADGHYPNSELINIGGNLYGSTETGGLGYGTLFKVTTAGAESVLFAFESYTGEYPSGRLINLGGTLYGTTAAGGSFGNGGYGIVYSMTQSGSETVLHSFGGAGDGIAPDAGLTNVNGILYGTTSKGGAYGFGTIFTIQP